MRTPTTAPDIRVPDQSLVAVANDATDNSRWENGIEFTPKFCDPGRIMTNPCPGPESADPHECTDTITFAPFVVEQAYLWDTRDLAADPEDMAREALEIGTTRLVERAFWTGEGLDPTDPTSTAAMDDIHPLGDVATIATGEDAVTALGMVLQALADSTRHLSGTGVVHVNPLVAVQLEGHLKQRDDGLYTVVGGHKVVVGDYPDDAVVGHLGDVDLYLGEIQVEKAFDHAKNELTVQAQRFALVAYNVCTAVRVTVGGS